jgi:acyl-CoA synthetase (AMP-forming)/AMP-acid ligase II
MIMHTWQDDCMIMYTSGSTGYPKVGTRSHKALLAISVDPLPVPPRVSAIPSAASALP